MKWLLKVSYKLSFSKKHNNLFYVNVYTPPHNSPPPRGFRVIFTCVMCYVPVCTVSPTGSAHKYYCTRTTCIGGMSGVEERVLVLI